jgi:hypothetical protein
MNIASHFEIIPLLSGLFWLVACVLFMGMMKSRNDDKDHYKYYYPQFFAKLAGVTLFMLVYLFYYGGGDTLAYWDGAEKLNNLFWESPAAYFREMMTETGTGTLKENFTINSGYPPGWIYREPESFFVSKIFSFFTFFTFKSFIASSFIIATIIAMISWHFFVSVRRLKKHNESLLAFSLLFIPTVLFWCTGISKDSLVLGALILFTSCMLRYFKIGDKRPINVILILIALFFIVQMRVFLLAGIIPALIYAYRARISKAAIETPLKKTIYLFLLYSTTIMAIFIFSQIDQGELAPANIYEEVIVVQQDFANNKTYTGKKYSIGLTGFGPVQIIQSIPLSIIATFYRPAIWEANSPVLLFNGLENLIILYLTLRLIFKDRRKKFAQIKSDELLRFSLLFTLIIGFTIGFTSGLFGVLVRLKSLILPFLFLILTVRQAQINDSTDAHLEDDKN